MATSFKQFAKNKSLAKIIKLTSNTINIKKEQLYQTQ